MKCLSGIEWDVGGGGGEGGAESGGRWEGGGHWESDRSMGRICRRQKVMMENDISSSQVSHYVKGWQTCPTKAQAANILHFPIMQAWPQLSRSAIGGMKKK